MGPSIRTALHVPIGQDPVILDSEQRCPKQMRVISI